MISHASPTGPVLSGHSDDKKIVDISTVENVGRGSGTLFKSESEEESFDGLSEADLKALEKHLVRKIDLHLIVALFGLFIFNILDRSNIASALLGGMQKDLHLTDTQYQTAVSIMFVGYLLGQIPSNIVLTRVRPSRYIPCAILLWGGISLCTIATHNFAGIFLVRFFLGFAESPFFAGALLLISSWYKPSEIAPRVALMYCGNTVANGFGGVLAVGILGNLNHKGGLSGWRWLYVIEGGATVLIGIMAFFVLPDFPRSGEKSWLNEQEQRFAEYRLAASINGQVDEVGGVKESIKDAVTDPKVWALVLVNVCILSSQTWTYFFPSIVKTLGYGTVTTLLLMSPVYVFGFLTSLGNSFVAQRTGYRAGLIMWPLTVDIIGNIMVISSRATPVRYIGMYLMCCGSFSAFNVLNAWVGSTVPWTRTKRAITYAMVNMLGNVSSIYGPYFFAETSAPQYVPAGIALSTFAFGGVIVSAVFGLYLRHLNKKASKAGDFDGETRYMYLY